MRTKKIQPKSNIIGQNIKAYRTKMGYTQEQLCAKLDLYGVNLYHSDIYLIEHNKRLIRDYEILAFSKVFNISLEELFFGTEHKLD